MSLGLLWPRVLMVATAAAQWASWHGAEAALAATMAGALLGSVGLLAWLRSCAAGSTAAALRNAIAEALLWLVLGVSAISTLPALQDRTLDEPARDVVAALILIAAVAAVALAYALARLSSPEEFVTTRRRKRPAPIRSSEVAVLIPAHNEERTIAKCLGALSRSVDMRNVFVGSDASEDHTVEIARTFGCHVDDIRPNRGKARVLTYLLHRHRIHERYRAVLLLDSDSTLDPDYLDRALPLFDDPRVSAVAGHVVTDWKSHWRPSWSMLFVAYRWRLYRVLQSILRYGQTWGALNVAYIVPGFASMYRTSVLTKLDISAPGLVIEDFNMTFELHRKRLGRIAYSPLVKCVTQDPTNLRDYVRQVSRWNLGFWQTVRRNGVWAGAFWLSLGVFIAEVLVASLFFLLLPLQLFLHVMAGVPLLGVSLNEFAFAEVELTDLVVTLLAVDYAMSAIVAVIDRKPLLLIYGVLFPFLRWLDAVLVLKALVTMWLVKSDGRWRSPARA